MPHQAHVFGYLVPGQPGCFWMWSLARGSRFLEESLGVYCTVLVTPRMERSWLSTVTKSWNCAHQGRYCPRHWDMDNKLFWRTGTVTEWTRSKEGKRQELRWEFKQLDWSASILVLWDNGLYFLSKSEMIHSIFFKEKNQWVVGWKSSICKKSPPPRYTHLHPPANCVSDPPRPQV